MDSRSIQGVHTIVYPIPYLLKSAHMLILLCWMGLNEHIEEASVSQTKTPACGQRHAKLPAFQSDPSQHLRATLLPFNNMFLHR